MNKQEQKEILINFNDELRARVERAKEYGIKYKVLTARTGFGTSTIKCWYSGRFNFTIDKALKLDEELGGLGF